MQSKPLIPRLRMIAGPNGSGKSTLFGRLRSNPALPLGYCLNPDEVERELQSGRIYLGLQRQIDEASLYKFTASHALAEKISGPLPAVGNNGLNVPPDYRAGYFTAILCDFIRTQWLASRESFTFETVMSHPDKIGILHQARTAGYRTYFYFVCTESAMINHGRVQNRVASGGHDVPGEKIRERYVRSLALLEDAIKQSDRAYLFDNSEDMKLIAEFNQSRIVQRALKAPRWFMAAGLDK